jgi:hypothetical protein
MKTYDFSSEKDFQAAQREYNAQGEPEDEEPKPEEDYEA